MNTAAFQTSRVTFYLSLKEVGQYQEQHGGEMMHRLLQAVNANESNYWKHYGHLYYDVDSMSIDDDADLKWEQQKLASFIWKSVIGFEKIFYVCISRYASCSFGGLLDYVGGLKNM